jgi:hypothetical protein
MGGFHRRRALPPDLPVSPRSLPLNRTVCPTLALSDEQTVCGRALIVESDREQLSTPARLDLRRASVVAMAS